VRRACGVIAWTVRTARTPTSRSGQTPVVRVAAAVLVASLSVLIMADLLGVARHVVGDGDGSSSATAALASLAETTTAPTAPRPTVPVTSTTAPPAAPVASGAPASPVPLGGTVTVTPAPPLPPPDQDPAAYVAAPPPPDAVPVVLQRPVPTGKGMWIWMANRAEGGNAAAIVGKARSAGLTHLYVRTGSSHDGFYAQDFLNSLLPKAHAAGLRVYGWDFPELDDVSYDVGRAMAAVNYVTPSGDGIDGFVADIETKSEGTNLSSDHVLWYGGELRQKVGNDYPLIAAVPRPSSALRAFYPYDSVARYFSAWAPMVYWLNRQPDSDVAGTMEFLARYGKPIIPVGQAYDGGPEGGRPGVPPPAELQRFMAAADATGAAGVSFWSWQHANAAAWETVKDAPEFTLRSGLPHELGADQVKSVQTLLGSVGWRVPVTGRWDGDTAAALKAFQARSGLPTTGIFDDATRTLLTGRILHVQK
jgi:peptidoglycan hydrolase-like protein with peptidoglycan-binding domain